MDLNQIEPIEKEKKVKVKKEKFTIYKIKANADYYSEGRKAVGFLCSSANVITTSIKYDTYSNNYKFKIKVKTQRELDLFLTELCRTYNANIKKVRKVLF